MPPRALKESGPGLRWKDITAVEGRQKWKLVDEKQTRVETAQMETRSSVPKSAMIDPPALDNYSVLNDHNPIPIDIDMSRPQVRNVWNCIIVAVIQNLYDYSQCNRDNQIT